MKYTPLLENAPRILVHTRGVISPEMADFWHRLRFVLRGHDHELMMMADRWTDTPIDVPWLRVRGGLDDVAEVPQSLGWSAWLDNDTPFDAETYLECERLWYGPESDAAHGQDRIRAIHYFQHFYRAALHEARPALTVIWNGSLPPELILRDLCHACGCPVQYVERAPFEGTIQLDSQGILGATSIAQESDWTWPKGEPLDQWHEVMESVSRHYIEGQKTWWSQPKSVGPDKLRKRLRIKPGQRVLLFAGQIDNDAQNMLYSPHFKGNLAAFQWFCDALKYQDDVLILGKHHPRSQVPPDAFRAVVEGQGVWLADVALEDCMALADRVAAVNSTVLYEGLMMDKPGLLMGQGLLSGKGIAYEVERLDAARDVIEAWLDGDGFQARKERWNDFGAYLFSSCLYSMKPLDEAAGRRSVDDVGFYLVSKAADRASLHYDAFKLQKTFIDEVNLWDEQASRFRQHEGFKEVLRGMNIVFGASLGKLSPSLYQRLLRLANTSYDRLTRHS